MIFILEIQLIQNAFKASVCTTNNVHCATVFVYVDTLNSRQFLLRHWLLSVLNFYTFLNVSLKVVAFVFLLYFCIVYCWSSAWGRRRECRGDGSVTLNVKCTCCAPPTLVSLCVYGCVCVRHLSTSKTNWQRDVWVIHGIFGNCLLNITHTSDMSVKITSAFCTSNCNKIDLTIAWIQSLSTQVKSTDVNVTCSREALNLSQAI